ncbi:hypothetical protein Tco_0527564 [Tanacetum coccineum]
MIVETIHVNFDELPQMASDQDRGDIVSYVVSSNMHTILSTPSFCNLGQKIPSMNSHGNPSHLRTRRQLEIDGGYVYVRLLTEGIDSTKSILAQLLWIGSCTIVRVYVTNQNGFVLTHGLMTKVYVSRKHYMVSNKAPRAWYDELSNFLVSKGFSKEYGTPMATKHLDADLSGTPTKYRSMVGALMYLTASRPDIVHATCYCARLSAEAEMKKHLLRLKRIFRYLKDSINMGLWYPKDTGFELTAFSDSDHAVLSRFM